MKGDRFLYTQLYIIGALYLLIPVSALIILRIRHKYRITSILTGVAAFFISMRVLMTVVNVLFSLVGVTGEFWNAHPVLNEILNVLLNVVFQNIVIYYLMKLVMKSRLSLYDSMAIGFSFSLGNCFIQGYYSIYLVRLLKSHEAGILDQLASDALPLETLQDTVNEALSYGLGHYYLQLFAALTIVCLTAVLCMLLYHALKKPDKKYILYVCLIHAFCLALIALSMLSSYGFVYFLANLAVLSIAVAVYILYKRWYREQQLELARRKKEYRQSLKSQE